ncbi:MAG: hypothetical protein HY686_08445 [Chloroflexi bacterium]|nr:hypothetical protein [Chloroflexota bacterium]
MASPKGSEGPMLQQGENAGRGTPCVVCGAPLDGENVATCYYCNGQFHQPWSTRAAPTSCGRIFAHQEAQGLVFVCQRCLAGSNPA